MRPARDLPTRPHAGRSRHLPAPDAARRAGRRGWQVDLVSSPINYMDGTVPERYAGRRYVREEIDGITHHWVRATDDVHRSFRRRARNYATFAVNATLRGVPAARGPTSCGPPRRRSASPAPDAWSRAGTGCPGRSRCATCGPRARRPSACCRADSRAYRVLDRFARAYARAASVTIVPAPGLVELVRAHGAEHVHLVTGAIEDRPPDPSVRAEVRCRLGIPQDACVFAYVGAHGVVNGLDVLLDAAELLAGEGSGPGGAAVRVLMAGAGSASAAIDERLRTATDPRRAHARPGPQGGGARGCWRVPTSGCTCCAPTRCSRARSRPRCSSTSAATCRSSPPFPGFLRRSPRPPVAIWRRDAAGLAGAMRRWAALTPAERRERGERAFARGQAEYGLAASVDQLEAALHAGIERGKRRSRVITG